MPDLDGITIDPARSFAARTMRLTYHVSEAEPGCTFEGLATIAFRRNPKRAQLLVSKVLAKHIPVAGRCADAVGRRLGEVVRARIGRTSLTAPDVGPTVVVGFCETGTGLGELVAEELSAFYVHTTRDLRDEAAPWLEFAEPHSHAPAHSLLATARAQVRSASVVVLVDDELSTGTTVMNLIREIQSVAPGKLYVVACLLDMRTWQDRRRGDDEAASVDLDVRYASLLSGEITVAEDAISRVAQVAGVVPALERGSQPPPADVPTFHLRRQPDSRAGGRIHQTAIREREDAAEWILRVAAGSSPDRILIVGTEETMYVPIKIAARVGCDVQSTSRSPIVAARFDGTYPIPGGMCIPSCYDSDVLAFIYNGLSAGTEFHDHAVIVTDSQTHRDGTMRLPGGLLAVARSAGMTTSLVIVERPLHGPIPALGGAGVAR